MKQSTHKNMIILCAVLLIAKFTVFAFLNPSFIPSKTIANQQKTIKTELVVTARAASFLQPKRVSKKRPRTSILASEDADAVADVEEKPEIENEVVSTEEGDVEGKAEEKEEEEEEEEAPKEPTEEELLQAEIKELEKQLNDLEVKAKQTQEKILESGKTGYMRAAAEVDNYKRNRSKDLQRLSNQGMATAASKLTPVLDQFEEVFAKFDEETASEAVAKVYRSYNALYTQLNLAYEKLGMTKFHPVEGEDFTILKHEKVSEETSEEVPTGKILSVVSAGYELNGVLVRPAKCVVSAGPAAIEEVIEEQAEEKAEEEEQPQAVQDDVSAEEEDIDESKAC